MKADPVDRPFRPDHPVQRIARVGGLISMTQTQGGTVTDSDFLEKCPTGIKGLDEITEGGLPRGRPSLVCGGPGCGKTILAMEFLVRGARHYDEPGFFLTFDETARDLTKNVASLGFNLGDLVSRKKLLLSQIPLQCGEIEVVGHTPWTGSLSRSSTELTQSERDASCWMASSLCFLSLPMNLFCDPRFVGCSCG